ncbi:hypothetical protein TNCV_2313471 [Trichonephila clavipes]|nr:hypothetical protein TNCV_2313471 [Trichonephila clavipes]
MPAHTLTRKRSCAARVRATWVRCCPRVAVMGVENTPPLRKRRLICEQHGGCKKGFAIRCCKLPTVKRLQGGTRCKVTFFSGTGRAGQKWMRAPSLRELLQPLPKKSQ